VKSWPPGIIRVGQFLERGTFRPPLSRLFLLLRCELRRSPYMLPARLCPAAPLSGASADKVALHVGEGSGYREHQASGAGAGVGPRLGQ
jgi:hypothetical protein